MPTSHSFLKPPPSPPTQWVDNQPTYPRLEENTHAHLEVPTGILTQPLWLTPPPPPGAPPHQISFWNITAAHFPLLCRVVPPDIDVVMLEVCVPLHCHCSADASGAMRVFESHRGKVFLLVEC